jgi:hypothetical protein
MTGAAPGVQMTWDLEEGWVSTVTSGVLVLGCRRG